MSQRRILVLVSQAGVRANGGLVSLKNILLGLPNTDITILTQNQTFFNDEMVQNKARVIVWFILPEKNKLFRLLNIVLINIRLFVHLLFTKYDAIHVNDIQFLLKSIIGVRLSGSIPTMNIRDTNESERPYGNHWKLTAWCKKLIALSSEMKEDFNKRLPLSGNEKDDLLTFVYSIVDHQRMNKVTETTRIQIRKKLSVSPEGFYVIVVAKFGPKKQQLALLEHLCGRLKEIPKLQLDFIGDLNEDADYDKACLKIIQKKDVANQVVLRGFQSDIVPFYQAADLVLVPSQREGLARCMIEGLSCSTPILSFSVCSAREILEGHNCGMVIEQGNYQELFKALKWFEASVEERRAMGERGWKISRELFKEEVIIAQYERLFFSDHLN